MRRGDKDVRVFFARQSSQGGAGTDQSLSQACLLAEGEEVEAQAKTKKQKQ